MTTKATTGLLPYAVKSTIVDLMDQRGFTDLRTAKSTNENVRRIYRKDMSLRQVRVNTNQLKGQDQSKIKLFSPTSVEKGCKDKAVVEMSPSDAKKLLT